MPTQNPTDYSYTTLPGLLSDIFQQLFGSFRDLRVAKRELLAAFGRPMILFPLISPTYERNL